MTIKEVETHTGLARSNIRFYEKEKLIDPDREENGYRDYSEADVEDIKKIAYLRTLGISVEEIRSVMTEKITLQEVIEKQKDILELQIADLQNAKAMCEKMLASDAISYGDLQVEQYVTGLADYWKENKPVLKLDSVGFLYLWGSFLTWVVLVGLCLLVGILFYTKLPPEIPVQWSDGIATSLVDKKFIFAYPVVCLAVRFLLRPCMYAKLGLSNAYGEVITEYLTNYLCFVALSVEVFSIFFVLGMVKNVVLLLAVDTVVLIGILIVGVIRLDLKCSRYGKCRE